MTRHTGFEGDAFTRFRAIDRAGPIQMLNLVKLRDRAVYADGRNATEGFTGAEAYRAYSHESAPVFAAVGGRIVWSGRMEFMLIGPSEEHWDLCFIAEYPEAEAFVTMIKDLAYRAAIAHRQAAVDTSRLIRMEPGKASGGFG